VSELAVPVPAIPELPAEWTLDNLAMLPEDGHRYEIVDGGLHVSPPPSMGHQVAASRLGHELRLAAPDEFEVMEGIGVDLGRSMFIPDIAVVLTEVAISGVPLSKPPDVRLVVEIVSPSSVSMDRFLKRARYAQAGIPSYWRVEFDRSGEPSIVVHDLDGDGYREIVIGAGERVEVERPFPVVLAPAGLVGPRT
jgi:Uma2 family endonuclease